jgi:hypothetical protein
MPLADVVRFVSDLMRDLSIDYVVIGGIAVSAQSEPRATKDVVLIQPDQVDSLLDEIERRGRPVSRRAEVAEKLKSGSPAKIIWDRKLSFDLRLASYVIDENALEDGEVVELESYGTSLKVAQPEDLIVYKLARFDDLDKRDIRALIAQHYDLDVEYIRDQAEILDSEVPGKGILDNLSQIESWFGR